MFHTNDAKSWLTGFGLVLGLVLSPVSADAEYRYLCTSIPSACEYTSPNVPMLDASVCWGRMTGVRLMPTTGVCPAESWPYQVTHGEVVDPVTNEVAVYVPLDDRCDMPGACVKYAPHDGGWETPICCNSADECYPGSFCGGVLFWCFDGVSNDDGTVTCFEGQEVPT